MAFHVTRWEPKHGEIVDGITVVQPPDTFTVDELGKKFPGVAHKVEIGDDGQLVIAWPQLDGETASMFVGDIWQADDGQNPSGGEGLVEGWQRAQKMLQRAQAFIVR